MQAIVFVIVAVAAAGPSDKPVSEAVRAAIVDFLQGTSTSQIEFVSLGVPVNAESCRIFDRSKGAWVSALDNGIAVHVRYRTRDRFGAMVMHSKIAFLDDKGKVLDAYDSGTVRSNDPRLMK